ncbi:multicopper oxidase family protein [Agromyces sp. NPDC055520]
MTTSALLAVHTVLTLAAAGLWLGAGFTAAGAAHPQRRELRLVATLALCAVAAVAGATLVTVLLADRGWWFIAEKATIGLPLAIVGSVAGVIGLVGWRGHVAASPLDRTLLLVAGFATTAGAGASWLIGYPPQPVAAAVLVAAVLLATGVAWAMLAGRGRRVVVGFAGMLALLLVAGVGWSWLSDTAAPSIEAGSGHGHGAAAAPATPTATAVPAVAGTARSVDTLRTPADAPGAVRRFELKAAKHDVELAGGGTVEAWGFGGDALPGPEIRVTEGDLVEAVLTNDDIDSGVTLHWHGYDVPNGEDGVAGVTQDAVAPGGTFTSRFVADTPGTYWYHTHQAASEGVRRGLYGMLVVEPAGGIAEDLDLAVPVHTFGGSLFIGETDGPQRLDVEAGSTVRLRVANTDQSPLRVTIAGAPFRVAAVDGRDLAGGAEVRGESVRLGAGARADLVVTVPEGPIRFETDASETSTLVLAPPGGDASDAPTAIADAPELDLLSYGEGPSPELGPFTSEGTLVLDRMPRFVGGAPNYAYTVNGQVFPHIEPITVHEGDLVRITVVNRGFDVHPMHVHGHHVLVLSRDGVAATGAPLRLDTVDVRPGEVWEVALRADNPGIWMDHCHDLEHAAQGMMMTLAYTGVTTPFEHGGAHANRPE